MQIARRQQEVKLAPLETRLIPVSYAQASEIQGSRALLALRNAALRSGGRAHERDDRARSRRQLWNQIEELTRSLDTQTPQVLGRSQRIVEATSTYVRDVGIQWGGDATFAAATGNPTGLAFPNSIGLAGGASDGNTPTAGLGPFTRHRGQP